MPLLRARPLAVSAVVRWTDAGRFDEAERLAQDLLGDRSLTLGAQAELTEVLARCRAIVPTDAGRVWYRPGDERDRGSQDPRR